MESILKSIPPQIYVAAYVSEEEVKSCDLTRFIETGLIHIVTPTSDEEAENMVNFAVKFKADGEAYTGAIALSRGWALATDENRVLKFFAQEMPHIQLITTPELLKHWVDTANPDSQIVHESLTTVEQIGRYSISTNHPCYPWWKTICP